MKLTTEQKTFLNKEINAFDLSVRAYNFLKSNQITTMENLVILKVSDLTRLRKFGKKILIELEQLLDTNGFSFRQKLSSLEKQPEQDKSFLVAIQLELLADGIVVQSDGETITIKPIPHEKIKEILTKLLENDVAYVLNQDCLQISIGYFLELFTVCREFFFCYSLYNYSLDL